MSRLCAEVWITPMILEAIEMGIDALKHQCNNPELVKAAKRNDAVGESIRATISNMASNRAILKAFVQYAKEQIESQD